MKTLLIILVSVTLSLGAYAQHRVYYHSYHPRVYVSPYRLGFGYPYGYPYFGYPYYGYPYGYPFYGNRPMPYKLSLQIQSIKVDYKQKIRETRKDKSLTHAQRRAEIRSLKTERDQEIISAQRNFKRKGPGNNQNGKNNDNSGNSSYYEGSGS